MSDGTNQVADTAAAPVDTGATVTPAAGDTTAATATGTLLTTPDTGAAKDGEQSGDSNANAEGQKADGEGKTPDGEGKKEDGEGGKPEPVKADGLQFGDGLTVDTEMAGELATLTTEMGLTQEQAQKIADLGGKMATKFAEAPQKAVEEAKVIWAKDAQKDTEFGGDKLQENLSVAKRAMDQFASPELKKLLDESGLGNHPEMIRLFYRAGSKLTEDSKLVTGGNAAQQTTSVADRLFGVPQTK